MIIPARIEAAEKFGAALHQLINGVEMAQTERNRAAGAAFAIAQDHQCAIVLLMGHTLYSSSFALLRCLFEAYLRGLWLRHCATDSQVTACFRGDEPPKTMIADIEAIPTFGSGVLSSFKRVAWQTMCDFTHTGGLHLHRWQAPDAIEPNFQAAELEECLNLAELYGAMSALEMAQMAESGDDGAAVFELIRKRWP